MKGGRKNLKRAVEQQSFTLEDGHSVMQVLSLRGSNLIEVGASIPIFRAFGPEIKTLLKP